MYKYSFYANPVWAKEDFKKATFSDLLNMRNLYFNSYYFITLNVLGKCF